MAIEKHQEIKNRIRDSRTIDERVMGFLGTTPFTIGILVALAICTVIYPWTFHLTLVLGAFWWMSVAFDIDRQVLPLYLPEEAATDDYHEPKEGNQTGYKKAGGVFFLGNEYKTQREVWETTSYAKQHKLILGTTGSGKSETLTGLFVGFLTLGAGVIYSDAKGTKEMVSRLYNVARRFCRDDDFFNMNYQTGGITVREGQRRRLTNTCNPAGFASADQLVQMFSAFLPKQSGDNQIFQDRAVALIAALLPCLVDLRDLRGKTLSVSVIRDHVTDLHHLCELAFDAKNEVTDKAKDGLRKYLGSLPNFSLQEFLNGGENSAKWPDYQINPEAGRMFGYASQYFLRALSSLSDTYGHIYLTEGGEVDYADIVWNRRICVISLPALEKAPTELQSLAKINLANIRGAIALGVGQEAEGHRSVVLDNLVSSEKYPTGIILDEYGYQATEGFAIVMAQARGLGFSVVVAGQDLSNIEMGAKEEADAIFGNAALITLNIRNVKGIGDRIKDTVGEATVAVSSGSEKVYAGPLTGYMENLGTNLVEKHRIQPNDLISLETGQAFFYAGKGIGSFKYYPWAPLPDKSDWYQINRYLPMLVPDEVSDEVARGAELFDLIVRNRIEGESRPADRVQFKVTLRSIIDRANKLDGDLMSRYSAALLSEISTPTVEETDILVTAKAGQSLTQVGGPGAYMSAAPTQNTPAQRVPAEQPPRREPVVGHQKDDAHQDPFAAGSSYKGHAATSPVARPDRRFPTYDAVEDTEDNGTFGYDGDERGTLEGSLERIDEITMSGVVHPDDEIPPRFEDHGGDGTGDDADHAMQRVPRGFLTPRVKAGPVYQGIAKEATQSARYSPSQVAPTHEEAKRGVLAAIANLERKSPSVRRGLPRKTGVDDTARD